ncbi:MAG: hypothetical protein AAFU41_11960 [Pseudomonadota bacterium]
MNFLKSLNLRSGLLGGLMCVALVACGASGSQISMENPDFFSGRVDRDTQQLSGTYNSSGYSEQQVRRLVASVCQSGTLVSFGQAPADGLIRFTSTCRGGYISGARAVEFEKTSPSNVSIEVLGSDGSGNLVFDSLQVSL